jgi:hypothetical protein
MSTRELHRLEVFSRVRSVALGRRSRDADAELSADQASVGGWPTLARRRIWVPDPLV